MTPASEPKKGATRRARDRWRRDASAQPEGSDITIVNEAAEQAEPSQPAVVSESKPRNAKNRSGVGAFVRENPRLIAAIVLFAVGIVLLILGWYGAAYTNILTEQIPYLISGGLLGLGLIIVAGILASSASTERENREMRRDLMRAMTNIASRAPAGGYALAGGARSDSRTVYSVPGGRSYHFAGCPIVEGKQTQSASIAQAMDSGLRSCMLCGTD
jgi:hypothetical protein